MKIIDKEKEKYQKVHTDDYQYGLGMRKVNDLLNENFDFSKRFNELAKKSKNALDIACGGGTVMDYVDTLGCKPSGIDISEAAIKKVDSQYVAKVAYSHELPFDDNTFDLVYFLDGMEHIPGGNIEEQSIREAFRVSAKFVCHGIALGDSFRGGTQLHINQKSAESWRKIIGDIANELGWVEDLYYLRNNTVYLIYKK